MTVYFHLDRPLEPVSPFHKMVVMLRTIMTVSHASSTGQETRVDDSTSARRLVNHSLLCLDRKKDTWLSSLKVTSSQRSGEPCFKCHHALQTSSMASP